MAKKKKKILIWASLVTKMVKSMSAMQEDPDSIPGEGNGNPLEYSHLGNPMDRGAWWVTIHGVAKSWA